MINCVAELKIPCGCINPKNIIVCPGKVFKFTGMPLCIRQHSSSYNDINEDQYSLTYLPHRVNSGKREFSEDITKLNPSMDLYSIVACVYEMITLQSIFLFNVVPDDKLQSKITSLNCTQPLKDLLNSILNYKNVIVVAKVFMKNPVLSCKKYFRFSLSFK